MERAYADTPSAIPPGMPDARTAALPLDPCPRDLSCSRREAVNHVP